jgi:hypothetical protein
VAAPTPTVTVQDHAISERLSDLDLYRLRVNAENSIKSYSKSTLKHAYYAFNELTSEKEEATIEVTAYSNDVVILSRQEKTTTATAGISKEDSTSATRYGFLDGGKSYYLEEKKDVLGVVSKNLAVSEEKDLSEMRAKMIGNMFVGMNWDEAIGYPSKDGFEVVVSTSTRKVTEGENGKKDLIQGTKTQKTLRFDSSKRLIGYSAYSEATSNKDIATGAFYSSEKVIYFDSNDHTFSYETTASYADKANLVAQVPTTLLTYSKDEVLGLVKFPPKDDELASPEYLSPKNVYVTQVSPVSYKVSAVFTMPALEAEEMIGLFSGSHFINLSVPVDDEDREEDFYFFLGIKGLYELGLDEHLVEDKTSFTTATQVTYSADVLRATEAIEKAPDFIVSYTIGLSGKQVGIGGLTYEKGRA